MIVYAALVVYLALLGVVYSSMRKGPLERGVFVALSFGAFAVVMGLRASTVGIDTAPYEGYYTRIGVAEDFMHIVNSAPVYSLLNKALYLICPDPQFLLICCSLIICGGVAFFVYHCSRNVLWSAFFYLTFYFLCNAMNGMRQAMAMALCLVAFTLVLKRKSIVGGILFAALAFGVHNTCIVFVPFVFLSLLKLEGKRVIKLTLGILIAVLFFAITIKTLVSVFALLFPSWYGQYIDVMFSERFAASGRNLIQTIFFAITLFVYFGKCVLGNEDGEAKFLYLPVLCGLALSAVFFQNYLLGARIPLYFVVLLIVVIPNSFIALGKRHLFYAASVAFVSIALFTILLNGNYAGVVPYEMVI